MKDQIILTEELKEELVECFEHPYKIRNIVRLSELGFGLYMDLGNSQRKIEEFKKTEISKTEDKSKTIEQLEERIEELEEIIDHARHVLEDY